MAHKLCLSLATTAFTIMLSGAAFARQPPALSSQQEAVARILTQCAEPAGYGYRDMLARSAVSRSKRVAQHVAVRRRMADHSVIACAGESLHTGGGYRDVFVRFQPESKEPLLALRRAR